MPGEMTILAIAKSHPRLTWLAGKQKNRRVPKHIVSELSQLKNLERAQAFLKSTGLEVDRGIEADAVCAVMLRLPSSLDSLELEERIEYHSPQIVLPKIECREVPLGTVLMNCLLPKIEKLSVAKEIFGQFQSHVLALSAKLEAFPFACITGFKSVDHPPHDLYFRGFRFIFSSQPDIFYDRVKLMLKNLSRLYELDKKGIVSEETRQLSWRYQESKSCIPLGGTEAIPHALLDDIGIGNTDYDPTFLVDFR